MIRLLSIAFATVLSIPAMAVDLPYKLKVVRDGQAHLQVAFNIWQGEYPNPVIDVASTKQGITTIKGWRSARKLEERLDCSIQNGIYHPWSQTGGSLVSFYTIIGVEDYAVTKDLSKALVKEFTDEDGSQITKIKAGDRIENIFYLSEGDMAGVLVHGEARSFVYFYHSTLDNTDYFKSVLKTNSLIEEKTADETYYRGEQWLYLQCAQGYKVFVQDSDLLTQDPKRIREGKILDYGQVGPANP